MTKLLIMRLSRSWFFCILLLNCGLCAAAGQHNSASDFDRLMQAATSEREAGRSQDAIRDYQHAVEIKPDWTEGWWYLGTIRYEANQFGEAQQSFEQVVQLLPSLPAAWNFLGLCEFENHSYAAARTHLEKGQSLGPGDDPDIARVAAYHLALLRIKAGEFEQASTFLLATFPHSPPPEQIRYALGLALLHVPLLPSEIDPSVDSLIYESGSAAAAIANGDHAKALESLRSLVKSYPDFPYLHGAYAAQLAAANHKDEANQQLRLEAALAPKKSEMGRLYGSHAGSHPATAGAESAWKEAALAYSGGQFQQAANLLKAWLQSHPNDGTAWAMLGLSEFELKDLGNAFIHLQHGRELGFAGNAEALQLANYRLAVLLNQRGEFDSAADLLTSQSAADPLNKDVELVLGMALLRMPKLPEEVDPQLRPIVQQAGEITALLHSSHYDEAFVKFNTLLAQSPALPFLHYAYGTALIALSRYEEAEAQMRDELKISDKSDLPYLKLASIAIRQHRPNDALTAAHQALKLAADSGEAHYMMGRAFLDLAQDEEAARELEIASKYAPNSPAIHFNLAKAYTRLKRPAQAEEQRAIFVRLNELDQKQRNRGGSQANDGLHAPADPSANPSNAVDATPR